MYSNNRRKSGKKCVLDTDVSPVLEKRIREKIVQDRIELKNSINEHICKRRAIKGEFKVDPKSLDDESLRERIRVLEKIRANLLRIISIKIEAYAQLLKEADDLRRNKLSKDVELENKNNEKKENDILKENLKDFLSNVKDLVEKINQYKEDYDKKKTTI
ncbi:uncharacterized protein cubi_03737 [Cryptosporidium ubiquitum]|uniref:Uncharacterized protein n=1 Tax=Cryptosporidium ubiquitum TaxID=857276 RepID=A0A1J4MLW3_9CRYT|nr:uncharacterized protein cubi_03737 [Cryptosporidium ubiquitum]OII75258.1 hypothetical protein cubi_03737 [Cryptosporidium ubiquitum]